MTKNTKIGLAVLGTAIVSGIGLHLRKRYLFNSLMEEIRGGVSQDISVVKDFFTGQNFIDEVNKKTTRYIKLSDAKITEYREKLYDAISGAGTDNEAIDYVFDKLKDGVQIAQVSISYISHYGEGLFQALKGDLSEDELKQLSLKISRKPKFRRV